MHQAHTAENERDEQPPDGIRQHDLSRYQTVIMRHRRLFDVPAQCEPDSIVLSFRVEPELDGARLDRFVQLQIPRLSRTRAHAIARACAYAATGRKLKPGTRVSANEVVLLVRERFQEPDAPINFDVVYDDGEVVAVNKPPGLVVHPSATYHRNTLSYQLRARYPERSLRLGHRLDRETSGLVLCCSTGKVEIALKRAFQERVAKKTYLAVVEGAIQERSGKVEAPLRRVTDGPHFLMESCDELASGGLDATTTFRVIARSSSHTLVKLSPRTGRQHQLRVHMATIGHPIVGDKLYGKGGHRAFFEFVQHGMSKPLLDELGHPRHALHAHAVRLPHPGREHVDLLVQAALPVDMLELCHRLGLNCTGVEVDRCSTATQDS